MRRNGEARRVNRRGNPNLAMFRLAPFIGIATKTQQKRKSSPSGKPVEVRHWSATVGEERKRSSQVGIPPNCIS
jgi:hypothetical protein